MALANLTRLFFVLILCTLTFSCATARIGQASGVPNFGQRRLLNLSGNSVKTNEVPPALNVEPRHKLFQSLQGKGFQEYVYNGTWELVNVSATLSTSAGEEVGRHFFLLHKDTNGGQPTWESFFPVSSATGKVEDDVTVSLDSISWLKLQATSHSGSTSQFGSVSYIQRLFTSLGLPPDSSVSANIGDRYQSPYSATYLFYQEV